SPTAGMTVAGLGVSRISLEQWWKTCWKFMILLIIVGIVITAISGMLPVA
ncbi:MAG: YfcC family protein, partial [Atopobiaceae bacterium]|nr:YfcC family protein [Atopobiaceae bacterium]